MKGGGVAIFGVSILAAALVFGLAIFGAVYSYSSAKAAEAASAPKGLWSVLNEAIAGPSAVFGGKNGGGIMSMIGGLFA